VDARERLHLIGSIPLETSEQVFRALAQELGPWLKRYPDGETGQRSRWVYFQGQMLRAHPDMEIDPTVPPYPFVQWDGKVVREINQVRFKPTVDPNKVKFETGYDKLCDASVLVVAPDEQRIARIRQRDRLSEEQIRARMASQIDPAEARSRATYVIENDANFAQLKERTRAVYEQLSR